MEADYSLLQDPDMKEIFDSFLVETIEILDKLDLDLVQLEKSPDDNDLLNDIFRSFHTIKGTSGFLGLVKLQQVTHRCEDILNKLRKGEAALNGNIMDGILGGYDVLKELLAVIETNLNEDFDTEPIVEQLSSIIEAMESGETEQDDTGGAQEDKQEDAAAETGDTEEKVEEIEETSDKESESPEPDEMQAEVNVEEETETEQEVKKEEAEKEKPKEEKKEQPATASKSSAQKIAAMTKKKGDNNIRVDVERLNELLNFVQELVLGRNRLTQINNEAQQAYEGTQFSRDLAETSKQIDLMTTELQLAVMKTRMVKIGKVFNRFPRLVRDLSKDAHKDIQLDIFGEDTELDKTLIEEINDPLVHLVRNSIDHGVETPEDREKKGKPRKGTITLSAEHEGNNIIISIKDDGKGINPEILKEKAVSKGLISPERAKELSKSEAYNLIFLPGFSTAQKVTNISGRGVGMDVVKTNVTKLRGVINIESEIDGGTTIVIKLPLTLAIIQGLLVKVCDETLVIPLSSVIEVLRVERKEIKHVNQREVMNKRDSVLPLMNIGGVLYSGKPSEQDDEWQYVVVVGVAEQKFGIKVDSLIGQGEIVIKSLGNYLGNINGIAGSTIMGDGRVVMILDLAELIHKLK